MTGPAGGVLRSTLGRSRRDWRDKVGLTTGERRLELAARLGMSTRYLGGHMAQTPPLQIPDELKPADGRFGSGPSRLRPAQLEHLPDRAPR